MWHRLGFGAVPPESRFQQTISGCENKAEKLSSFSGPQERNGLFVFDWSYSKQWLRHFPIGLQPILPANDGALAAGLEEAHRSFIEVDSKDLQAKLHTASGAIIPLPHRTGLGGFRSLFLAPVWGPWVTVLGRPGAHFWSGFGARFRSSKR